MRAYYIERDLASISWNTAVSCCYYDQKCSGGGNDAINELAVQMWDNMVFRTWPGMRQTGA